MATWTNRIRPHNRRTWILATGATLLLLLIAVWVRHTRSTEKDDGAPTAEVRRGPLTISLSLAGTIKATAQEIIKSQVEGQTTLIYVIEEGTRVKQGDLLVELDASDLQDRLIEQQIDVKNAEADFVRAREGLAVTRNQAESDIALAELTARFAKEDLQQYTEGMYKQEQMQADSRITLAEEELQLAQKQLEWSEKLYGEAYISQADRDSDRLAANRARLDLELAKADKFLLENFTHTRKVAQLTSDVSQAERALERVKLKSAADIVQAEVGLEAKESELMQQRGKEVKVGDQIGKTRITAPREGLVVYATSANFSWRGNTEPLETGQSVRERQELIYLPTADEMMTVVHVHESNLDMVRVGLPVVISVDALPGRQFVGKISKIAPLPNAASMWMNPDLKVYPTEILIDGRHPDLRTGVSCLAEIVIDRYEDALYVPIQAVVRVEGHPTVYVESKTGVTPRRVEVGLDNNRMIHVLSGLADGERVLLAPPLADTEKPESGSLTGIPDDTVKKLAGEARQAPKKPRGEARSETPDHGAAAPPRGSGGERQGRPARGGTRE